MPRRCLVCLSPDRPAVDEALVGGTPFRNVAERFGTSVGSLFRHRRSCIPAALVRVEEARKGAEAGSLYAKVQALEADARRLKEKAERDGDIRAALVAVDKLLDVVRFLNELRPAEVTERRVVSAEPMTVEEWTEKCRPLAQAYLKSRETGGGRS